MKKRIHPKTGAIDKIRPAQYHQVMDINDLLNNPIYRAVTVPGRFIIWLRYMFPGETVQSIVESARHRNSVAMEIIYSAAFYFACLLAIIVALS